MKLTFKVEDVILQGTTGYYMVALRSVGGEAVKITTNNKLLVPAHMQIELWATIKATSNKVPRKLDLVVVELGNG